MASKRQPALSTQLKATQAEVEALKKKVADAESTKKTYADNNADLRAELAGIHDVLDALPEAPPKRIPETYTDRSAPVRLAAYFAAMASRKV